MDLRMVGVILYKVISKLRSSIVIFIGVNVKGKRNKKIETLAQNWFYCVKCSYL